MHRNQHIDQHNFLAGAATMPLIGVLTALAAFLFWRKKR
ncbi:LPXTG cell wall anchor domain-containing protein [Pantoea anthophila]|nr:LPXTG cell wall anchor domain-containing protein [Pantoea anthophila]MEB7537204.1 LPXTG cell wall anchor domain-containing protein [Pantoea anthophila]